MPSRDLRDWIHNAEELGEWTGYCASSMRPEPIMRVKRLYHRNNPILLGAPPTRPPWEFNDVTNTNDVLWALTTRSNPEQDIEIIRRSWSGVLDPIIPKGQVGHNSRAVIDCCRPFEWMKDFPPVAESSPEVRRATEKKWGKILSERNSNGAKPKEPEPVGVESGSARSGASRTERKR